MVPGALTFRFANLDPDTPEIETSVRYDGWTANSTAYVDEQDFATFVEELTVFARNLTGEVAVEFGRDDGIGMLSMRWQNVRPTGHIVCHLALVTADEPNASRRVSIPLHAEPAALDRFLPGLRALYKTRAPATLELRAEWP